MEYFLLLHRLDGDLNRLDWGERERAGFPYFCHLDDSESGEESSLIEWRLLVGEYNAHSALIFWPVSDSVPCVPIHWGCGLVIITNRDEFFEDGPKIVEDDDTFVFEVVVWVFASDTLVDLLSFESVLNPPCLSES